ncbi:S1/P1 nuclease [Sandaracinobacter sp. RS1-74]|uniref:S1/P1 nuclease n=1 Tax=Sandaracinobacteroides sayramensis TaxID=2913411 RepID=UPI001EDB21E8|nr:S1/P1 nuclease [Sandaracinobacteroides sayramensis]MCG2841725.1 S1/P1 nuclease [Sandaracinobacteroides sayramensis]
MRFAAIAAVALAVSQPAFAWGLTGHRITGAVADEYLSPKARAGVKDILGTESLAEASNWPDFMRSDPDPFWQKESVPWHYVTIPADKAYADVGHPPEGDSITALTKYAAIARDAKAPLAERQKALRFVIHIVGDLSQPLHVGRPGDRGGNDVKVSFFGEQTNLHTLWDSTLIAHNQLSYTEWAGWLTSRFTTDELRDWSSPDPQQWLADSVLEREAMYPANPDLRYSYVFEQQARLNRQLGKGGLRLASYLNALFDTPVAAAPQKKGRK